MLPIVRGTSANGDWAAQQFIAETQEEHPVKMLFEVWGQEKIDRFAVSEGEALTVLFDPMVTDRGEKVWGKNRVWNIKR